MDQNVALGSAGAGESFTLTEGEFTFMPINQGMQVDMSAWLKRRLKAEAMDTASAMRSQARALWANVKKLHEEFYAATSPEEKQRINDEKKEATEEAAVLDNEARAHIHATDERIAAGGCAYGGTLVNQALNGADGTIKLYHLMLLSKHPGLTLEQVGKMYQGETNGVKNWDIMRAAALAVEGVEKKPLPASTPASASGQTQAA